MALRLSPPFQPNADELAAELAEIQAEFERLATTIVNRAFKPTFTPFTQTDAAYPLLSDVIVCETNRGT